MKYQVEKLIDVLEELQPLLLNHYHEIAWRQDKIDLNPDYERYFVLEEQEMLMIVTARDDGELVGYSIYFLSPNIHYSDHKFGVNDIVYLDPAYRKSGYAVALFDFSHKQLKERGCTVATIHMKTKQPFEELALGLGYDKVEYNYSKYLGE